jgi:hypothetical protein
VCVVDADCPGYGNLCKPVTCEVTRPTNGGASVARCVEGTPVNCDDNDPCTKDTCHPATGKCSYAHATPDNDGDGHFAPLPGFAPGSPGSCGDDCDDTNPHVYPGAPEVCDGIDNDCDGVADEGAVYLPNGAPQVRISGPLAPSEPGGLAWNGTSYAATYVGDDNGFNVYLSSLTPTGEVIKPPGEQVFTLANADAAGAPILWIGDRYGIVWQDRRTGNYEVWFDTLDATGMREMGDVQITNAEGFSVNPTMAYNGSEFLVAWQDDRSGIFDVYVQRLDSTGARIGDNLQLTQATGMFDNESPVLAPGQKGVGLAWSNGTTMQRLIEFQVWSPDFSNSITPPIPLTDGTTEAEFPVVVWNHDRYVVAWYDKSANPKAVYAATLSEDGTMLVPPKPVTKPGAFRSRYPFLHPLGDRVLLVYSDDRDQNQGYELYTTTLHADLTPLGNELRVTNAPHDSVFPYAAFGHLGNFGVAWRDDREGGQQNIYFTTLQCVMPGK